MTLLLAFCRLAEAQQRIEGSYYCAEELVGGFKWEESLQRWDSGRFRPNRKFILQLQLIATRKGPFAGSMNAELEDYTVTITDEGTSFPRRCTGDKYLVTVMKEQPTIHCSTVSYEFRFSLQANRFISAYLAGYYMGNDDISETPMVAGGKCTKIK